MASLTQRTWVWTCSRSWWPTWKPGMLQSMSWKGSDTSDWLNWIETLQFISFSFFISKYFESNITENIRIPKKGSIWWWFKQCEFYNRTFNINQDLKEHNNIYLLILLLTEFICLDVANWIGILTTDSELCAYHESWCVGGMDVVKKIGWQIILIDYSRVVLNWWDFLTS